MPIGGGGLVALPRTAVGPQYPSAVNAANSYNDSTTRLATALSHADQYFGPREQSDWRVNPFGRGGKTSWGVTDLYLGERPIVRNRIVDKLINMKRFMTTRVLPLRWSDELVTEIQQWDTPHYTAVPVAVGAPPPYVQTQFESKRVYKRRFGLAFRMLVELLNDPKLAWEHIHRNETILALGFVTYQQLRALQRITANDIPNPVSTLRSRRLHGRSLRSTATQLAALEAQMFGALQKLQRGLSQVIDWGRNTLVMNNASAPANAIILPGFMDAEYDTKYTDVSRVSCLHDTLRRKLSYFVDTPVAAGEQEVPMTGNTPERIQVEMDAHAYNGLTVYVNQEFQLAEEDDVTNIMERQVDHGTVWYMGFRPSEHFEEEDADIFVLDEEDPDRRRLTMWQGLANSALWNDQPRAADRAEMNWRVPAPAHAAAAARAAGLPAPVVYANGYARFKTRDQHTAGDFWGDKFVNHIFTPDQQQASGAPVFTPATTANGGVATMSMYWGALCGRDDGDESALNTAIKQLRYRLDKHVQDSSAAASAWAALCAAGPPDRAGRDAWLSGELSVFGNHPNFGAGAAAVDLQADDATIEEYVKAAVLYTYGECGSLITNGNGVFDGAALRELFFDRAILPSLRGVDRFLAMVLASTPLNLMQFKHLLRVGIQPPFTLTAGRFHQRYLMRDVVVCVEGEALGYSTIGRTIFNFDHSGGRGYFHGYLTAYSGNHVVNPNNACVLRNVSYAGIVSGVNTRWANHETYQPDGEDLDFAAVLPLPDFNPGRNKDRWGVSKGHVHFTGEFPKTGSLMENLEPDRGGDDNHYFAHFFYQQLHADLLAEARDLYISNKDNAAQYPNAMGYQGLCWQEIRDSSGKPEFVVKQLNKGCNGQRESIGAIHVMKGNAAVWPDVSHEVNTIRRSIAPGNQ